MSNWSDISKNFEKWLKENPEITGIQYEKKDGEFAAIKYSEQFKLFIAQYDGDDDLNMDSFTKSMKTDDNGENKNNTLLQDMMSNYIGNLRTDDKVFQAIDGLDGSEKDGKISEAEKNMFLQKVTDSSVGIDGDADNLTFDEVSKTVGKIIDGDLNIFGVNNTNPIEAVADTQMSATLQQFSDEVSGLSEVLKSWEPYKPKAVKAMDFVEMEGDCSGGDSNFSLDQIKGSKKIKLEISCAVATKNEYAEQYKLGVEALDTAKEFEEENAAVFGEIRDRLASTNEEAKKVSENINSTNSGISQTNAALDEHCSQKDAATIAIGALNSQIAQLEASLNQENISDDEKATIRSQIAELEKEKADLQAQIVQLGEQILADEAQLKELHETLDSLYAQMETLITNCEDLSENERSVYLTSTQNERKIAKIHKDVEAAQAQMTYWDIRVDELRDEYELALEQEKEAEVQEKELIPDGVSVIEAEEDTSLEDVLGLANPKIEDVELKDGVYSMKVDGKEVRLSAAKDENGFSYSLEQDGEMQEFKVDYDENETVEAKDCVLKFDGYAREIYSENPDAFNDAIEAGTSEFKIDGTVYKLRLVSNSGEQPVWKISKSLINDFD